MAERDFKSKASGQADEALNEGEFCEIDPGAEAEASRPIGQQVRETASRIADQGKQAASGFVEKGKEMASNLAGQSKGAASDVMNQIQARLYGLLKDQKHMVADRLGAIGGALRQATEKLQNEDDKVIAPYASSAADSIEQLSQNLHEQDLTDLVDRAQNFARRQPELFLGASFLGGVLLARFLKTAWSRPNRDMSYQSAAGASMQEPAVPVETSGFDISQANMSEPGGQHI